MKKSFLGICLLSSLIFASEQNLTNPELEKAKQETYQLINENMDRFSSLKSCIDKVTTFEELDVCANNFTEIKNKVEENTISYEEAIKETETTLLEEVVVTPENNENKELNYEDAIKQ